MNTYQSSGDLSWNSDIFANVSGFINLEEWGVADDKNAALKKKLLKDDEDAESRSVKTLKQRKRDALRKKRFIEKKKNEKIDKKLKKETMKSELSIKMKPKRSEKLWNYLEKKVGTVLLKQNTRKNRSCRKDKNTIVGENIFGANRINQTKGHTLIHPDNTRLKLLNNRNLVTVRVLPELSSHKMTNITSQVKGKQFVKKFNTYDDWLHMKAQPSDEEKATIAKLKEEITVLFGELEEMIKNT